MVVYRYSSLHLASILLAGLFVASSLLFFSPWVSVSTILCGLASYVFVTILCYHKSGNYFRDKLDSLMLLLLAYTNSNTPVTRDTRSINTSVGPIPASIHFESQKIVQLIVRDFVISWYSTISTNKELPQEVIKILQHLVLQLHLRIQAININDIVLGILPIINPFIVTLNEVGYYSNDNGPPIYDVNHPFCAILFEKNPRLTHPALKSPITEIHYLQKLVDSFMMTAIPSQYRKCDIVLQLIRNILVYRVFRPVFDLVCDPMFLLEAIPMILSKLPNEKRIAILNSMNQENVIIERELSTDNGLLDSIINYHAPTCHDIHDSGEDEGDVPTDETNEDQQAQQLIQSVSAPTEDLVHVPLPSVYISRHVSVDTKEGVHTGYIIKFPKSLLDVDQLDGLGITSTTPEDELESLKRFSEFSRLHKTLTKSNLGLYMKGATLPDKRVMSNIWSKMSSSELSPAMLLERKEGLDKYIQALSNVPEICDSSVFKEFLESGVSVLQEATIVSNKKSSSRKPSNIDLRRTTQYSFDIEAQDIQSVLDIFIDMQILLPCCDLHTIDKAPPSTHTLTPPTIHDVTPPTTQLMTDNNHSSSTSSFDGRGKLLSWLQEVLFTDYSDNDELISSCCSKAPLFSCIMNLANDATMKTIPELWLTNTSTQLALINVFGKTIDTFLWKELHEVVDDSSNWARMLYNLRHTLWPNGQLTDFNKQKLTQEQKDHLRKEAIKAIKEFLPNLLPILIGNDNYNATINHCLDTIQNTKINRHLLYHIVDLLFLNIVPQCNEKEFQQRVLDLRSKPLFVA